MNCVQAWPLGEVSAVSNKNTIYQHKVPIVWIQYCITFQILFNIKIVKKNVLFWNDFIIYEQGDINFNLKTILGVPCLAESPQAFPFSSK